MREAYQCEIDEKDVLSCNVCIPWSVAWQPSPLTREAINEEIVGKYMVFYSILILINFGLCFLLCQLYLVYWPSIEMMAFN